MATKSSKHSIQLGPVPVTTGPDSASRMAIMLWGPATVGKSTFAATAPGKKLWLSLGDNEHISVAHRKDVMVANLAQLDLVDLFKHMQSDNPFNLETILRENEDIGTVVLDSLTALTFRALQQSVRSGTGKGKDGFIPTMMAPGQSAYGGRNAVVLECVTGLMRVTALNNVHFIVTAHEADPTYKTEAGKEIIDYIGVMLGGQIVNNMTYKLSEIWYMSQYPNKEQRRLAMWRTRLHEPMKSRMFRGDQEREFDLMYNPDKPDDAKGQMTISGWYNQWVDGGAVKLDIPSAKGAHITKNINRDAK